MQDFIPTRVSRIKKDAVKEFVLVNYEKPKKKRKKSEMIASEGNSDARNSEFNMEKEKRNSDNDERRKQELEMKRVRFEVMKFGMSGFEKVEAKKAEVALAISLGAKPEKKKGTNYKRLKDERKSKRERQRKDVKLVSGVERSLTNHKTKKSRKKVSDGLLGIYGKVSKKTMGKNKK